MSVASENAAPDNAGPASAESPLAAEAVILITRGPAAPEDVAPLDGLVRGLRSAGYVAVELAHARRLPPGFLTAAAAVASAGARIVHVVPMVVLEDSYMREHLPAEMAVARRRHPSVEFALTAPLNRSPGLIDAVRGLVEDDDVYAGGPRR